MDIANDISITQLIIGLAGGVTLLIWGLKRVQQGMNRAYGSKLAYLVRDRFAGVWSALGLGATLTLILQSSTAAALLAASLGVQAHMRPHSLEFHWSLRCGASLQGGRSRHMGAGAQGDY